MTQLINVFKPRSSEFSSARFRKRQRRGAVIPMLAILLPVVIILAAFAINIAYLELNRTEMFIASDAVSRATGR